jgi:hypothetical protein
MTLLVVLIILIVIQGAIAYAINQTKSRSVGAVLTVIGMIVMPCLAFLLFLSA